MSCCIKPRNPSKVQYQGYTAPALLRAIIFPNSRKHNGAKKNGFIRTDNYRARLLKKLGEKLGLAS